MLKMLINEAVLAIFIAAVPTTKEAIAALIRIAILVSYRGIFLP